ncbi:hypothetical protein GQ457_10G027440 [Hibiscus cannabinus]
MESPQFGHEHPLAFDQDASSHQQSEAAHCSRCGDVMSGPSFRCAECEFYLHKECAEAPLQLNHPLHRDHPLRLLSNPPAGYEGSFICNFCGEKGERFLYHCSCKMDLHIKCALLTFNFAQKNSEHLQGIAYKDPSISTQTSNKELESCKCFACWEPLFDYAYYSLDRGFNLHKKCLELSSEIDHPHHYEHLLLLQLSVRKLPCIICYDTTRYGLCYCCSLCSFTIHIACLSPPSTIQGKGHQHPFTLFFRQMPFTCDACGVHGNSVPYMCSNCNLLVHKKCISLPPIIKFCVHEHPLFHSYSIRRDDSMPRNWDCIVCLEEVNTKHGSYYCSECHFILHVNCATEADVYSEIEPVQVSNYNRVLSEDSYIVMERNEGEEAIMIKHFTHEHNLILCDKILEDNEFCDGCTLPVLNSFYHCLECSFFLHKKCVELPKNKFFWFDDCGEPLTLIAGCVFICNSCGCACNGFRYKCHGCELHCCLGCITPLTLTCEGHEHPVSLFLRYGGPCTGCGEEQTGAFICKTCEIGLCFNCVKLPSKLQHKYDEHLLTLKCEDNNTYPESHFCDICEEDRNPSYWFYRCATCDTSAHSGCVLGVGNYSKIKCGKIYREGKHSHPLRFVKKKYYYPECFECGVPCRRLALECTEPGCEYIVHWKCVCPHDLREA